MRCYEPQSPPDLLIPDGYPELIFVHQGAYRKRFVQARQEELIIDQSCFVGIQTRSVIANRLDHCHLTGLKLFPWAVDRLLGQDLLNTADRNIHLNNSGRDWLATLARQLQDPPQDQQVVDLINQYLRQHLTPLRREHQLAEAYLKSILETKGQLTVTGLARKHFISTRQLQRTFKRYLGITPKKFIAIIRFKQLYKESILQKRIPENFLDYGYYDQMHFIKDFRKQLGTSPTKAMDRELLKLHEMAAMNA